LITDYKNQIIFVYLFDGKSPDIVYFTSSFFSLFVSGTVEQGEHVLNHLEKIVKKKANTLFLKGHKDRNVPT